MIKHRWKSVLYLFGLSLILVVAGIIASIFIGKKELVKTETLANLWRKPVLIGQQEDEKFNSDKNRGWTQQEADAHQNLLEEKLHSQGIGTNQYHKRVVRASAPFNLNGRWVMRGPYNQPGAWNFCEMDDGTDTLYAITCGHYGGVQFIFKGTLAGDDFKLISKKFPNRFRDLIVIPRNGGRRVLAGVENGTLYYSDDAGKTWTKGSGLPARVYSTIVNRQDNFKLYSTDGRYVYVSTDFGTSFTQLTDLGSSKVSRLYTPRYASQPGAANVYLAWGGMFKKLSGTSFVDQGQFNSTVQDKSFSINGDTRLLYVTTELPDDGTPGSKQPYWTSTDEGRTWTKLLPTSYYYSKACEMSAFTFFGVNPENPQIVVAGYCHPTISLDGCKTTIVDNSNWGIYQSNHGTVAKQNDQMRKWFHPDIQGSHFFFDKNNKLFSVRATDGGIFISYNEWIPGFHPVGSDYGNKGVYRDINLLGGCLSTETYDKGMISGIKGIHDFALGTQDQGVLTTDGSNVGECANVIQNPGGDGEACFSGEDGLTGWFYNGSSVRVPFPLYEGTKFLGQSRKVSTAISVTTRDVYVDYGSPSTTLWVTNGDVSKVVYSGSLQKTDMPFNNTGNVAAIALSPVSTNTVWVLDNNKVYKSTNSGGTWSTAVTVPMSASTSGGDCRGWSSAVDASIVLFAGRSSNSVTAIMSTDGGSTWVDVSTGMPKTSVRGMVGEKSGRFVFISTPIGPYIFDVQAKTWADLAGDDAPWFDGRWCTYNNQFNFVRFSTWGQGIWDYDLSNFVNNNDNSSSSNLKRSSQLIVKVAGSSLDITIPSNNNIWDMKIVSMNGKTVFARSGLKNNHAVIKFSDANLSAGKYVVYVNGVTFKQSRIITITRKQI